MADYKIPGDVFIKRSGDEYGKALVYYVDADDQIKCCLMTPEEYDQAWEERAIAATPQVIWNPGEVPVIPTEITPLPEEFRADAPEEVAE